MRMAQESQTEGTGLVQDEEKRMNSESIVVQTSQDHYNETATGGGCDLDVVTRAQMTVM